MLMMMLMLLLLLLLLTMMMTDDDDAVCMSCMYVWTHSTSLIKTKTTSNKYFLFQSKTKEQKNTTQLHCRGTEDGVHRASVCYGKAVRSNLSVNCYNKLRHLRVVGAFCSEGKEQGVVVCATTKCRRTPRPSVRRRRH